MMWLKWIIPLTCFLLEIGFANQESAEHRIAVGVIEERYGRISADDLNATYQTGVRPLFYWNGEQWESYETLSNIVMKGGEREGRFEFSRQRNWHIYSDNKTVAVTAKGGVFLADGLRWAVQDIVSEMDKIPKTERSSQFASDAIGMPVRPPIPVSTVVDFNLDYSIVGPQQLSGSDIPQEVVEAGYAQVLEQHNRRYEGKAPELRQEQITAMKALLKVANKYTLEREGVSLFAFVNEDDSVLDWTSSEPPWICEEQQGQKRVWALRETLKFIAGGDFNMDGSWEYLFWIDAYNENGYLMASEGLREVVSYSWHYH